MDAVEEIKSRLNIEDVVSEYVELKRSGRNWKGLSPFTNERSPSFMVSPEKQIWHDFSSGKGGNIFSFIMEVEGLDFKEALELLARKANIELADYRSNRSGDSSKKKARLYDALELATKFYQVQFSKNRQALEYVLQKRGFTKETALEWQLGYSPDTGDALVQFLKSKKFTEAELQSAGLTAKRYRGCTGDMFRGRIMIPLCDQQGKVIGFTARLLRDDPSAPKYINTPQTMLYDKSRHIYGLHLAKEQIRKTKYVVVAEGNLDVISSHQAGIRQVVATAGTAMTEGHLKALSRFTGDIRLSYDADNAGMNATERAIPIASKVGVSLSIISIPQGKDPDELIRHDAAQWRAVVEQPQYALDWLIERYKSKLDLTSAPGKREFSTILVNVIRGVSDQVEQEHYLQTVAEILSVSTDALVTKFNQAPNTSVQKAPKHPRKQVVITQNAQAQMELVRTQNHFMALVLLQPRLRPLLESMTADMMVSEDAGQLLVLLQETPDFDGTAEQAASLRPIADYVKMISLLYDEYYRDDDSVKLHDSATTLKTRLITQYATANKNRLIQALQSASSEETASLLAQVNVYNELLNRYRGGS